MARLKTSSTVYETGFRRLASVKSIDTNFDLGNTLTAVNYQKAVDDVKAAMDEYNTTLSVVDDKHNFLKAKELTLRDWNERILTGVAAKYGKGSSQYEQAGGKRKTEIKRSPRKPKA